MSMGFIHSTQKMSSMTVELFAPSSNGQTLIKKPIPKSPRDPQNREPSTRNFDPLPRRPSQHHSPQDPLGAQAKSGSQSCSFLTNSSMFLGIMSSAPPILLLGPSGVDSSASAAFLLRALGVAFFLDGVLSLSSAAPLRFLGVAGDAVPFAPPTWDFVS
jgi:hypothetical protein